MEQLFERANEIGVRLEIVGGLPLWEAFPSVRHQESIDRIRASIQPVSNSGSNCACVHLSDVYVRFPDGSLKRPDVSVFCRRPDEEDDAVTLIPEAVIEVISKGYEAKDLEIGPRFYLLHGVKDVIVFDPYTLVVLHVRRNRTVRRVSPVDVELECGCRCTV